MWEHKRPLGRKKDAAKVLGVSVRTLERLIASGEVEHIKLGRQVRFDMDLLVAQVRRQEADGN